MIRLRTHVLPLVLSLAALPAAHAGQQEILRFKVHKDLDMACTMISDTANSVLQMQDTGGRILKEGRKGDLLPLSVQTADCQFDFIRDKDTSPNYAVYFTFNTAVGIFKEKFEYKNSTWTLVENTFLLRSPVTYANGVFTVRKP